MSTERKDSAVQKYQRRFNRLEIISFLNDVCSFVVDHKNTALTRAGKSNTNKNNLFMSWFHSKHADAVTRFNYL